MLSAMLNSSCRMEFYTLVDRLSLADAELPEDHIEHVLDVDPPGDAAERTRGKTHVLGDQLGQRGAGGPREARPRILERRAMTRARRRGIAAGRQRGGRARRHALDERAD